MIAPHNPFQHGEAVEKTLWALYEYNSKIEELRLAPLDKADLLGLSDETEEFLETRSSKLSWLDTESKAEAESIRSMERKVKQLATAGQTDSSEDHGALAKRISSLVSTVMRRLFACCKSTLRTLICAQKDMGHDLPHDTVP